MGGRFGVRTALGAIVFRMRLATCIRFGGLASGINIGRPAGRLGGSVLGLVRSAHERPSFGSEGIGAGTFDPSAAKRATAPVALVVWGIVICS